MVLLHIGLFLGKVIKMNKLLLNMTKSIPDELYIKIMMKRHLGYWPDLKKPHTFNEKLQWLKLHNRNPKYTSIVDKIEAKRVVASLIGEEFIIPTLKVYDSVDDINLDELPEQFVLKCNHDSQSVIICKEKKTFDLKSAKKRLQEGLQRNGYWYGREWPYKNVKPRIFAEKYMEDSSGGFVDYKFFCFNGVVDCVMVCLERHLGDTKFYFFDKEWNLKRLNIRGKNAPKDFTIPKPNCMDEMFDIAADLSNGIPFVRIDLYESFGQIYFGECTFFPDSGFDANLLLETDVYFGSLLDLNQTNNNH